MVDAIVGATLRAKLMLMLRLRLESVWFSAAAVLMYGLCVSVYGVLLCGVDAVQHIQSVYDTYSLLLFSVE